MTNADIITRVLQHEGVLSNVASDPGGETAYGISRKYHPEAWMQGPPTKAQAIVIYQRDYLQPFADVEPVELRAQVVDIAVNCGVTAARGMLAMARQQTQRPVPLALAIERLKFYARKVKANPKKAEFLLGWVYRTVDYL